MDHRTLAYSLLAGDGLEIGALHNPAQVPPCCRVSYCDAMSEEDARRSFPELASLPLVHVSHIVNLDHDALTAFGDGTQDFVILNHVIEHVANPIRVMVDCFRVLRDGGKLVMSAPDMRFSFDRNRNLTPPEHLWAEYEAGVTEVTDAHYADFLQAVHPEVMDDPTRFAGAMIAVRDRREHAHVWNSASFQALLKEVVERQHIAAHVLVESLGEDNANEYFSVWQKGPLPPANEPARLHPAHTTAALAHVLQHWTALRAQVHDLSQALHGSHVAQQALSEDNQRLQVEMQRLQTDMQRVQAEHQRVQAEWISSQQQQHRLSLELASSVEASRQWQHTAQQHQQGIADKDRHIANIESQLQATHQVAQERMQVIEAIYRSRSWRWTRWLRRSN
jgi:SAM-dependent methyltransferase